MTVDCEATQDIDLGSDHAALKLMMRIRKPHKKFYKQHENRAHIEWSKVDTALFASCT